MITSGIVSRICIHHRHQVGKTGISCCIELWLLMCRSWSVLHSVNININEMVWIAHTELPAQQPTNNVSKTNTKCNNQIKVPFQRKSLLLIFRIHSLAHCLTMSASLLSVWARTMQQRVWFARERARVWILSNPPSVQPFDALSRLQPNHVY